jgi:hypothetical protein
MSSNATLDPITRFLLAWAAPVLLLWLALYATTLVPTTSRDSPAVWPFQIHLAVAMLVPVLNVWVFLPRFHRKAAAFLSGLAVPAIALFALLTA